MLLKSMLRCLTVAAASCAALALSACGGGDAPPAQPAGTVIGAAGGTVTGPNGAQVVIPAGALASDVTIAITQSAAGAPAMPGGFVAFGQTFAFTPHGTTFAVPVTITVPFDTSIVPAGRTPLLYKTNAQSQWEFVANATVTAGNLTAQVNSFSWTAAGNSPPTITQQPGDASVQEPGTAIFMVVGSGGASPTLQWERFNVGTATWGPVQTGTGGNTSTYTTATTTVAADNGARFRVVITDTAGLGSAVSNEVTLTVTPATPPPTTARLTVTAVGSGDVVSSPAGITCPGDCTEDYAASQFVTLTATPASGFVFSGWSGDGDCSNGSVTMSAARNCTATFSSAPTTARLTVTVVGSGDVVSSPTGITCPGDCTEDYAASQLVTLAATPASGFAFSGWSGDGDCSDGSVTMSAARNCTATFTAVPPPPGGCAVTFGGTGLAHLTNNCFNVSSSRIEAGVQLIWTDLPDDVEILLVPTTGSGTAFDTIYIYRPMAAGRIWSMTTIGGIPGIVRSGNQVTLTNVSVPELMAPGATTLTLSGTLTAP